MANNVPIKNYSGTSTTFKTTDNASVHTPHHNVDTIAAGASADIGATSDAAVVTDTSGSLSGKFRGLVKWAFERMPAALGQTTMSASLPVVLASNQTGIPISAGVAIIGGVKNAGPFNTVYSKYRTSTDLSGGVVDLSDALADNTKRIFLDDLLIAVGSVTLEVTVKEETSGTVLGSFFVLANTSFHFRPMNALRAATANKKLQVITSASGNIRLWSSWHEET